MNRSHRRRVNECQNCWTERCKFNRDLETSRVDYRKDVIRLPNDILIIKNGKIVMITFSNYECRRWRYLRLLRPLRKPSVRQVKTSPSSMLQIDSPTQTSLLKNVIKLSKKIYKIMQQSLNSCRIHLSYFVWCQRDEGFRLHKPLQRYFPRSPVEVRWSILNRDVGMNCTISSCQY